MADLIKATDNLNEGRIKLNKAITDTEEALTTAKTADEIAKEAKTASESTQEQLDTIVIEGDSSVEAAQARVNNSGTAFPTLKQRLDAEHQEVTAQLQQKADQTYVDTLVSNVASGTPKELFYSLNALRSKYPQGAEGTMLVLDSSYVDSAHSFIWDGEDWADLGAYQGVEVADRSVTLEKTTFLFEGKNKFNSTSAKKNTTMSPMGQSQDGSGFAMDLKYIPVKAGEIWTFRGTRFIGFYDQNKSFLKRIDNGVTLKTVQQTIEANGYVRAATYDGATGRSWLDEAYIAKEPTYSGYEPFYTWVSNLRIGKDNIKEKSIEHKHATFLEKSNNLVNRSKALRDTLMNVVGVIESNDNYVLTDYIPFFEGKTYHFNHPRVIGIFNNQKANGTYVDNAALGPYEYIADSNGFFRCSVTKGTWADFMVNEGNELLPFEPYGYKVADVLSPLSDIIRMKLEGKPLVNIGDSIAAGDGNLVNGSAYGYADMIAEDYNMRLFDYSKGGASVTRTERTNIIDQLESARNIEGGFVFLQGVTNDAGNYPPVAIGEISEGYEAELDEETFCGAFESLLKKALKKYPTSKILYIYPHKMDSRKTYFDIMMPLINEMLNKWSVDRVNLFDKGGLNSNIFEYRKAYTNPTVGKPDGDGTHPNEAGYRLFFVPKIVSKMISI